MIVLHRRLSSRCRLAGLVASSAAVLVTSVGVAGGSAAAGPPDPPDPSNSVPPLGEVIDIGSSRPNRDYDEELSSGLADVQQMWAEEFERLYGEPWVPLEGGIYAAYPERTEPIPGCGWDEESSYQDVADTGAFYCSLGDFMAFDDGPSGLLALLTDAYGDQVIPVVLAHEYGHAVQQRIGAFDGSYPTVYTEQQADCFAGAWSRRAWSGQASNGVEFDDADVLAGLRSLHAVRDPVGYDILDVNGHGSAFDRIGAYQTGFIGGLERCVDLLDTPLPLLPNQFTSESDRSNEGNAPFNFESNGAIPLITGDLAVYWPATLEPYGVSMPEITLRPVTAVATDNCGQPLQLAVMSAVYCVETSEVLFNVERARELYDSHGDFAVGYIIGHAWSDAAQIALQTPLTGEAKSLVSDCLTGAWFATVLEGRTPDPGRRIKASPGDLDEAVQTAIQFGDAEFGTNREGSAFEKIAYLRIGVIDGVDGCLAEMQRLDTGSAGLQLPLPTGELG